MKLGAENKKQVRWMIALLAIALMVGIYNLADFGTSSASSPASSRAGSQAKTAGANQTTLADSTIDPRFHGREILDRSQRIQYENGRNIFRMEEPKIETSIASPRVPMGPNQAPTPTPTPPPPPILLKFYGFASKPNEPKRIFLADEGEVFIARQGDIVERKYKVVQINNTSVLIEDVLNNNRQPIPLTAR